MNVHPPQTVVVFPPERKALLRDAWASAAVRRVVSLGSAVDPAAGLPRDRFYLLQRFVRRADDEV